MFHSHQSLGCCLVYCGILRLNEIIEWREMQLPLCHLTYILPQSVTRKVMGKSKQERQYYGRFLLNRWTREVKRIYYLYIL